MKKGRVSVVIVNYNGKDYLDRCLGSILKNNYRDYEVVIVDNASTDGSVELIKNKFGSNKKFKLVKLPKNYGPARARNEGVAVSTGQYLAFLDNDTQVDKSWISEAVKLFKVDNRIGCLQCKILLISDKTAYDYAGEYLNQYGFLFHRASYGEKDRGQYDQEVELLAAKSAGMFIRKEVFEAIDGFDEDYFIYVEETDLGWRSWLRGFRTIFCPRSIVYHEFSSSLAILGFKKAKYNLRFHGTKNYLTTLLKNLGWSKLAVILPKHLAVWLGLSIVLAGKGNFSDAFFVLKGICWSVINLKKILGKRREIQSSRQVNDQELFKHVFKKQEIMVKIKQFIFAERYLKKRENA